MALIGEIMDLLSEMNIAVDSKTEELMRMYLAAIEEGNKRFNLTRVHPEDMVHSHICDALAPLAMGLIPPYARVLDVGAGAGVPGIPLKLARHDITLTLLDSTLKKVSFMRETLAALTVNAQVIHARAEALLLDANHRAMYDIVVARAVAPLKQLLCWTAPFIKHGGVVICYKGPNAPNEIVEVKASLLIDLHTTISVPMGYRIPDRDWNHYLIVCNNIR